MRPSAALNAETSVSENKSDQSVKHIQDLCCIIHDVKVKVIFSTVQQFFTLLETPIGADFFDVFWVFKNFFYQVLRKIDVEVAR